MSKQHARQDASGGYGNHSLGTCSLPAAVPPEEVTTALFRNTTRGETDRGASTGWTPAATVLALTPMRRVALPVTSTLVNSAQLTLTPMLLLLLLPGCGRAVPQRWMSRVTAAKLP